MLPFLELSLYINFIFFLVQYSEGARVLVGEASNSWGLVVKGLHEFFQAISFHFKVLMSAILK
jgi:hypothetical protein